MKRYPLLPDSMPSSHQHAEEDEKHATIVLAIVSRMRDPRYGGLDILDEPSTPLL